MPKQEEDYILSEQEIADLFKESQDKYLRVVTDCHPIYQHLKKELEMGEEAESLINATVTGIVSSKTEQRDRVLRHKLERVGFQVIDPYYLACMKPIAPLIYHAFFRTGQTANDVDSRFAIEGINQGFEELGGNAHYRFKRKFYSHGKTYFENLQEKGILQKFPGREVPSGTPRSKYISLSWVTDFLSKMRKTAREEEYLHLIRAR